MLQTPADAPRERERCREPSLGPKKVLSCMTVRNNPYRSPEPANEENERSEERPRGRQLTTSQWLLISAIMLMVGVCVLMLWHIIWSIR